MRCSGWYRAWLAVGFALALSSGATAQDYPNRTIRMIVPVGAGGVTDILARLMGKSITDQLGQPVIIENRPGAGGTLGTRAVAQSDPDGYTLLMVFPSHAANPALYASLPYDSEKDFSPISMVTRVSEIMLVPNSSPAKTVQEFIALARKEHLNYGSVGVGSLAHLSTELFLAMAGVKMTHIPYRGVPQAEQAVMTAEVATFFDTPITALPQIRAGTVRGARHHHRQAARGGAGDTDNRGIGPAGLRSDRLERRARARQHAAADRRQAQQDHCRGAEVARNRKIHPGARSRTRRQQPGRVCQGHARRHRKMDSRDPRGRHPAAIEAARGNRSSACRRQTARQQPPASTTPIPVRI
jgi:hypothetical protein